MEKQILRRSLLQQRQSLLWEEWQCKSEKICQRLQDWTIFQQAQTVLTYFSVKQEPDLSSLFSFKKTWGVPRCVEKSLVWHCFPSEFPLHTGTYGITEPHFDAPIVEVDCVDLILVPCVACDIRGYRLGYGGGFYDRLFSSPSWASKPTIGIVFQFGLVAELAIDPWDCTLHAICTEEQIIQLGVAA